jgi:hypothetical protein
VQNSVNPKYIFHNLPCSSKRPSRFLLWWSPFVSFQLLMSPDSNILSCKTFLERMEGLQESKLNFMHMQKKYFCTCDVSIIRSYFMHSLSQNSLVPLWVLSLQIKYLHLLACNNQVFNASCICMFPLPHCIIIQRKKKRECRLTPCLTLPSN